MRDANCIFCKILDGVIPSAKLYERSLRLPERTIKAAASALVRVSW